MKTGLQRLAVIGGGWAGLAAAIDATQRGWQVTLFEMAPQLGGRARSFGDSPRLDNGQHILIGAYSACLHLMRTVGVDPDEALLRTPLSLHYPDGPGLSLRPGLALPAFARAVLSQRGWSMTARLALLQRCSAWLLSGFRCAPDLSVAALCRGLPPTVQRELIEPLCVAALNTPAALASGTVFLRVVRDALFQGRGASDLLLPRRPLSELFAEPAGAWLTARGTQLRLGRRVQSLQAQPAKAWRVDGELFDAVVLACSAPEAARLAAPWAPDWASAAAALRFEPIVTVYLESAGAEWPTPMLALREGPQAPAQFAFDLGRLGHAPGRFAFVISGASAWVEQGLDVVAEAVLQQARTALSWAAEPRLLRVLAERRATFACTPALQRPGAQIAPGLAAAADYVEGPYPATLEGAARAGLAGVAILDSQR